MRLVKTSISILALLFSQFALSTAYDDDKANFYVEGQSLNTALTSVNQIMCFVSNMRANAFVNAGPYNATIYEEDCTTGKSDTSGDSASATATSASSSTTASSTTSTTTSSKTAATAVLNATRLSSVSPVKVKTWVSAAAQSEDDFDQKIYVDTTMVAESLILHQMVTLSYVSRCMQLDPKTFSGSLMIWCRRWRICWVRLSFLPKGTDTGQEYSPD